MYVCIYVWMYGCVYVYMKVDRVREGASKRERERERERERVRSFNCLGGEKTEAWDLLGETEREREGDVKRDAHTGPSTAWEARRQRPWICWASLNKIKTHRSFNCLGGEETEAWDLLGEAKCVQNSARTLFQCQGGYKEGCECLDANDLDTCTGGCLCSPASCCKKDNCSRPLVCMCI